MASRFTFVDFLGRWLFAAALVFGTYNPSGYSYFSWVTSEGMTVSPTPVLVGIILLIAWIVFIRATFLSLGRLGIVLGAALFSCFIWFLIDRGWLTLESTHTITWLALAVLSLLLATGMSWSHIRRRLTGQVDVDDVDD